MICAAILLLLALPQASGSGSNTDQLLRQAIEAQQHGDLDTAIRDYRQLLRLRPDMVGLHVNLGAALADKGQFDQAVAEYVAALPHISDNDSVRVNLGLAYFKKGDMQNASSQFQIVRHAHPDDAKVAILLGETDLRLGKPAEAATLMQTIASANAENPDFDYVYGSALVGTGKLRDGAVLLEKSAQAEGSADAYMLAGSTALKMNSLDEARKDLDAAILINPQLPGLWTLDGVAHDRDGDPPGAEAAFRRALQTNPNDFDANIYLGAILYKRREMDESKQYLTKALELGPNSRMARYEMAMWENVSGQYQAAASRLEKLVAEDPKWLDPHVELATLYYKLHRSADGEKERTIVDQLTAEQQAQGPR
jgi:Flp pilus assembly protein TadD